MKLTKPSLTIQAYLAILLLLASPCLSASLSSFSSLKSSLKRSQSQAETQIAVVADLANIAHKMAYSADVNYLEKDVFESDFKVYEKNNFKCSFGRLKTKPDVGILVFRGTVPSFFSNIIADLNINTVPVTTKSFKKCFKGCLVHKGFNDAYRELREEIRKNVSHYVLEKKVTTFYITGHSLGGAMAVLATYDLANYYKDNGSKNLEIGLVTFGAPRVGNEAFAKHINDELNLKINARIKFNKDLVPNLPPFPTMYHSGTGYVFNSDSKTYTIGDYNVDKNPRFNYLEEKNKTKEAEGFFKKAIQAACEAITKVVDVAKAVYDFGTDHSVADHSMYKTIDTAKLKEILQKDEDKNNGKKKIAAIADAKVVAGKIAKIVGAKKG